MNSLLIVGIIVASVALLFSIIATAMPYWLGSDMYNMGLFRACLDSRIQGIKCENIGDPTDWIKATRAMMILSILALSASLVLAILFGFVFKDKQIVALGAAFMCFAAADLILLGVIIFGAKIPLDLYDMVYGDGTFHASYGLAIVALVVALVAGVFFFLSRTRNVKIV